MKFTSSFPPATETLLGGCPQSGSGTRAVHRWILEVADALRHHTSPETAAELIRANISRRPKPREIEEAVEKAFVLVPRSGAAGPHNPRWPRPNATEIDLLVSWSYDTSDPLEAFKRRSRPIPLSADQIIETLFGRDTLLCAGLMAEHSIILRLNKSLYLERFQFVVPNPMRDLSVKSGAGKRQTRCLSNVASRRFIVVDFDLKADEFNPLKNRWAAAGLSLHGAMAILINFMAETAPLALVVYSGNVSLQAWFYTAGKSDPDISGWFYDACYLGADSCAWTVCQYFRMPYARRRDTGKVQEVIFFDPSVL